MGNWDVAFMHDCAAEGGSEGFFHRLVRFCFLRAVRGAAVIYGSDRKKETELEMRQREGGRGGEREERRLA